MTLPLRSTGSVRVALWLIAALALAAALKLSAVVSAPVTFALVLGIVLSPLTRQIDRLGVPDALGAFLTLMLMLATVAGLVFLVEPLLARLVSRAPLIWEELSRALRPLQSFLDQMDRMSGQVSDVLGERASDPQEGGVAVPTVEDALAFAPDIAAALLVFVGTLYFFLLSRSEIYRWIAGLEIGPRAVDLLEAERDVSRYFLTITVINAGYGVLVAGLLWGIGLPYAILWGTLLFFANFVLYLGPALLLAGLAVAGAVAFEGAMSVVPALLFLCCNILESQFVTPSLVGRQMAVNPLLIFLSLVFWLWLWGPVGGIIAIPLLVWGLALRKRGHNPELRAEARALSQGGQ